MATLLQTLLIETLAEDTDPVLRSFIETLLPSIEREFGDIPALGGSEEAHFENLKKTMDEIKARQTAQKFAKKADQSLLVHVLNALLIAWNLQKYLPNYLKLSEIEKYLLCLGMVLHDYDKAERGQKEDTKELPKANEIPKILEVCRQWGERLKFAEFFPDWQTYLLEIAYLAQNTQFNQGSNIIAANWEIGDLEFQIDFDRLNSPLCSLLAFGDVAVHMSDPLDLITVREGNKSRTTGDALREHLELLGIEKKLVYHRLRDCRGLITNQIHNSVVNFVRESGWEPILFFAQGAIYLSDRQPINFDLINLRESIWQTIIYGDEEINQRGLVGFIENGDVGFVRDGKGLKAAPQITELFLPSDLVRQLARIVRVKVANAKVPATPKRLEKLDLSSSDRTFLMNGADLRADRLAEYIIFVQQEFFAGSERFIEWILIELGLDNFITTAQTQVQSGGVNYGWYQVAAHYVSLHSTQDIEEISEYLENFSDRLAIWAKEQNLLTEQSSPTHQDFSLYLESYLEISETTNNVKAFQTELTAYTTAKATNQAICSLSSGELEAEDQLDSVVLFKQQQYSNKNSLGGGRIKRGISRIWALEMLLRQAFWGAPAGKLEDRQPVFLYIYPAYVYSPQVARAIKRLVKDLQKRTNLWSAREKWQKSGMKTESLQMLAWRDNDEVEAGKRADSKYSDVDLPFLAVTHTTTLGKTVTDAWVEPTFLALALPKLLGVKVVATSSPNPLYASDKEFLETVKLDGAAGFWNLLGMPASLRLQDIEGALQRLLVIYSLHLDNRSDPPDGRWQALNGTVREVVTNVLNIFSIANEGLRKNKRERPTDEEVSRYWDYAQVWSKGNYNAEEKMKIIEKLVKYYKAFYKVSLSESTHTILLPLSKAMEIVLSSPNNTDPEDLILEGSGQLHDALYRQEIFKRPFLINKEVEFPIRKANEMMAIHKFMSFFVNEVFGEQFNGDRALLQENRNRIKSGVEFAYRIQALQDKQADQGEISN